MSWEQTGIGLLLVLGLRAATFVMAQRGPVNVAMGLPESAYDASSYYKPSDDPDTIRPASNTANGNTDGTYTASNCIHTDYYYRSDSSYKADRQPWWQVRLDKKYYVYLIKIWARDSALRRLYPFSISVDGNPCVSSVTNPQTREITVKCTKPIYGQTVRFTRADKRSWDYTLNMCEFQILVCNPGYHGTDCDKECDRFCSSDGCLMNNGSCISCHDGYWGSQCENQCGHCQTKTCDIHTGQCADCEAGWYGMNCNDPCLSDACDKKQCDRQTGVCLACTGNLEGDLCNDCKDKTYGQNCSQQCGHCFYNTTCNVVNGECNRCKSGWQPPLCQEECKDGTFGDACAQQCGHCKDGAICEKQNGDCPLCDPGWYPPSCSRPCDDGWYGVNCSKRCGVCLNGKACEKDTGHCACPSGKQPPLCVEDCQGRRYGKDCLHDCGHCKNDEVCDPVTGHCRTGCQPGWTDPPERSIHLCKDAVQKTCPSTATGPSTAIIAGANVAVVFVIVIIAVVVVLVMRKKYRGKKSGDSYSHDYDEVACSRDGPSYYSGPNIINTTSLTMSAVATSGEPEAQVNPTVTIKHAQSSKNNDDLYEDVASPPQKPAPTSSSTVKPERDNSEASPTPNGSGKAGQKGFPLSSIPVKGKKFTPGEDTPVQSEDEEADFDDSVYANEGILNDVQPTDIRLEATE